MCKRLHIHAICLRAHIIKQMIISVICTNMHKGNKFFLKSPRPSLPLKRAPPLTPPLSPSGKREETALLGAQNRYALRLAGHQSPRHVLRDGTAGRGKFIVNSLHVYATCLRTHIIKHMIISVICTNMRKGTRFKSG